MAAERVGVGRAGARGTLRARPGPRAASWGSGSKDALIAPVVAARRVSAADVRTSPTWPKGRRHPTPRCRGSLVGPWSPAMRPRRRRRARPLRRPVHAASAQGRPRSILAIRTGMRWAACNSDAVWPPCGDVIIEPSLRSGFVRSSMRLGLAMIVGTIVLGSCGGVASHVSSPSTTTKAADLSSMPVQSGYDRNEDFCAQGSFGGTIRYRVSSGRATIRVALRRLPKAALVGIEWSNNTVRGYLIGTVRTDRRGNSIPGSERLLRIGESRGYRIVLTQPDDNQAIGNLWPCGPPRIVAPAIAVNPNVTISPSSGLADGATVKVTVSGFGIGEKIFLSECDSAVDANDLGCGPQLAAQPFVVTGSERSGSANFVASERAASTPNTSTLSTNCAALCVLVATQGDGLAWAAAPLTFGSAGGGASGGASTTFTTDGAP